MVPPKITVDPNHKTKTAVNSKKKQKVCLRKTTKDELGLHFWGKVTVRLVRMAASTGRTLSLHAPIYFVDKSVGHT